MSKEIMVEEKKVKKVKEPIDKARKKKIIRRSILGIIAVLILFFIVNSVVAARNAKAVVYTHVAQAQDIEQTVNTSGTVKTQQTQTYFSKVAIPAGDVKVAVGDAVAEGDVIFSYDEEALAREKELAELTVQASVGSSSSSLQKDNESKGDLNEANINLSVLDQQIADTEAYIKGLEDKIEKKQRDLEYHGTLLQMSLLDWSPASDEYEELQKQIQLNSYEQKNSKEIVSWNEELKVYNEMLADYKEYKSEMKSQQGSAEASALNQGSRQEMNANNKSNEIKASQSMKDISEVEGGVKAEFDGVVTEMNVVKGASAVEGTQLFKVESTEDVKVEISISKYDLEKISEGQKADITIAGKVYEGEISKISKMAELNASGSPVIATEIKILNPDQDIYLGVEAKVLIYTNEASGVVAVPVEAVNTDKEGDFIYVVENNIFTKRRVVTGISSDIMIEIKEGLTAGEQIVTDMLMEVEEGTEVMAIPAQ